MAQQQSITVPIALSCNRSATITLPWFVQQTEYNPAQATFKPLVNGEEAFGTIYNAMLNAKSSVDIICWGFQPSMYFKRGSGSASAPIGQLLAQLGADGIKVRLLCWQDDLHLAELSENEAPGNNLATSIKPLLPDWFVSLPKVSSFISKDYQAGWEREFDIEWYRRANLNNVTQARYRSVTDRAVDFTSRKDVFRNVEFATRDFSFDNRDEIDHRIKLHNEAVRQGKAVGTVGRAAMKVFPTHHQKMVLVDYEIPERAVGFVMGHNMLDTYWDKDDHSYVRMHAQMGRNGLHPRQDMSSRVSGPVLAYLNENFCQAWDEATGQNLTRSRAAVECQLTLRRDFDTPVMAQVLRTQSQHGKRDIARLYLQAVNNATKFIYIENQYFRWPELAEKIKQAAAAQVSAGRDPARHGSIYLFVVTNSNDEGIGPGTVNTYNMLKALGKADSIPTIARLEENDDLRAQLTAAQRDATAANLQVSNAYSPEAKASAMQYQQETQAKVASLQQQIQDNNDEKKTPILPVEIPGLKVRVCTLVAPDSPPDKWDYVYVHAKLMIVDDVFMTLGSANINLRSMAVDSELNICHENMAVTQPLRRRLWSLHTGGFKDGASDRPVEAFKAWTSILKLNAANKINGQSPVASLIGFSYTSAKRSTDD
ncbi:Cardiolipin synthase [Paraburkholderia hiiakae]|uniref:Cardiolipin synthase n=1 Tax=Paraburkholderia hiiakae TaxID=1081782 RepID=A0ABN7I7X0_9BURK|nr:phospholipase D-like domain-containing protein [Paraburkholderia hiiakae]CAD6553695.1 Cardiolipin synthase [Paraburkholderia hiiakae]